MLFLIASSLSEHHHTGMRKSYQEQKLTDGHKQEKVTKFFLKLNAIQQLYKLEQNTHTTFKLPNVWLLGSSIASTRPYKL